MANEPTPADVGAKAVKLLREMMEQVGPQVTPELAVRVRLFLDAIDWHETIKNMLDGGE